MRHGDLALLDRRRDLNDGMFLLGWRLQCGLLGVAHQMLGFQHQLLD